MEEVNWFFSPVTIEKVKKKTDSEQSSLGLIILKCIYCCLKQAVQYSSLIGFLNFFKKNGMAVHSLHKDYVYKLIQFITNKLNYVDIS